MRTRRTRVEEAASHDRWLVSWADFITLLFAFFVVLFASAYRDNQAIIRLARAIHQGFQTLGAFSGDPAGDALTTEAQAKPGRGSAGLSAADVAELKKQIEAAMGAELKSGEIEMRVTPQGFVISLNEMGFFNSGQAVLLPGAAGKIEKIARVLAQHHLELRVEGHSDNQPIHNAQFRSNWELSTARAMTVLMLLLDKCHYDPSKLSVAGYGQYRPVAENSTLAGRRRNRRVDLLVLDTPARAAP